jgi:hypothetical protein
MVAWDGFERVRRTNAPFRLSLAEIIHAEHLPAPVEAATRAGLVRGNGIAALGAALEFGCAPPVSGAAEPFFHLGSSTLGYSHGNWGNCWPGLTAV